MQTIFLTKRWQVTLHEGRRTLNRQQMVKLSCHAPFWGCFNLNVEKYPLSSPPHPSDTVGRLSCIVGWELGTQERGSPLTRDCRSLLTVLCSPLSQEQRLW